MSTVLVTGGSGFVGSHCGYGKKPQAAPFDEASWTDTSGDDVRPYVKSKAIAERAAWDSIAREGGGLELSVVNPVGVFGPSGQS